MRDNLMWKTKHGGLTRCISDSKRRTRMRDICLFVEIVQIKYSAIAQTNSIAPITKLIHEQINLIDFHS